MLLDTTWLGCYKTEEIEKVRAEWGLKRNEVMSEYPVPVQRAGPGFQLSHYCQPSLANVIPLLLGRSLIVATMGPCLCEPGSAVLRSSTQRSDPPSCGQQ